ncbi:hypothetical protein C5167_023625 [Papaver somniferum]|uniref:Uncharacterized protein n=1 Tax=Papaver somniferum TaxID=3469 RepID=A0A4Y7JMB1_PAPSO|nr:hypothetical protein C5167_023625 [Papaver somniferum]
MNNGKEKIKVLSLLSIGSGGDFAGKVLWKYQHNLVKGDLNWRNQFAVILASVNYALKKDENSGGIITLVQITKSDYEIPRNDQRYSFRHPAAPASSYGLLFLTGELIRFTKATIQVTSGCRSINLSNLHLSCRHTKLSMFIEHVKGLPKDWEGKMSKLHQLFSQIPQYNRISTDDLPSFLCLQNPHEGYVERKTVYGENL